MMSPKASKRQGAAQVSIEAARQLAGLTAITIAMNFCCRDAAKAAVTACYAAVAWYSFKLGRRAKGNGMQVSMDKEMFNAKIYLLSCS